MRYAVAWIGFATLTSAQGPVPSWPAIAADTVVEYEGEIAIRYEVAAGDQTSEVAIDINSRERHTVVGVATDGGVTLRIERLRTWGQVPDGQGGLASFDTESGEELSGLAAQLVGESATTQVLSIAPGGALISVRPLQEDGELGEPDVHKLETMQAFFLQHSEESPRAGNVWVPAAGLHECAPSGCHQYDTRNELVEISDDTLTVETRATPPGPGTDPEHGEHGEHGEHDEGGDPGPKRALSRAQPSSGR